MSDQTSTASLYDSWFRVLPSFFAAITPTGNLKGRAYQGIGGEPRNVLPGVKAMLDAAGVAQQALNTLYRGYAQALGAKGPGASVESLLHTAPEAMKRTLEQLTQLLGAPNQAFVLDPRVPHPLMSGLAQAFTALGDAIGLGPTRALRDAYRDLLIAIADQRTVQLKYIAFLGEALGKVNERLLVQLREMAGRGETVNSLLDLVRLWASVADDALHDAMQSEKGVAYTTAYIRGATRSRQHRNRLIEILSELCNVPTRAEIDDIHREIHDLKKQLRRSAREARHPSAAPRKKPRLSARKGSDR